MNDQAFLQSIRQYDAACPVIAIRHRDRKLRYMVPNKTTLWRAQTLTTKEPGTIRWLEAIAPGSVLLDVGANVGMYTIFAAVISTARVFAFEPESQNYALLCKNIVANQIGDRVTAYCAALSDSAKFSVIHLSDFAPGGSCHSFDQAVDFRLQDRKTRFSQGCFSTTIDQLVHDEVMPTPNYIKIDVDGFEHKVIAGTSRTLRDPVLKSLIIEINPHLEEHRGIVSLLQELGFRIDPEQIAKAARTGGTFEGVGEYVFTR